MLQIDYAPLAVISYLSHTEFEDQEFKFSGNITPFKQGYRVQFTAVEVDILSDNSAAGKVAEVDLVLWVYMNSYNTLCVLRGKVKDIVEDGGFNPRIGFYTHEFETDEVSDVAQASEFVYDVLEELGDYCKEEVGYEC